MKINISKFLNKEDNKDRRKRLLYLDFYTCMYVLHTCTARVHACVRT